MKRFLLLSLAMALVSPSVVAAQGGLFRELGQEFKERGRQIIQRELGQIPGFQQGNPPGGVQERPRAMGGALPSEGGSQSGGGGQRFLPDNQFTLPGAGGGSPIQTDPRFYQDNGTLPYFPEQFRGQGQPIYSQEQPFLQPNPSYQQPYQRPQYQTFPGNRLDNTTSGPRGPIDRQQAIMIRCAEGTQGTLNYSLNSGGQNFGFSMRAGQEQHFDVQGGWIISFNDGSVQKRYRLEGGRTYTIKRDAQLVWKLFADR